MRSLHPPDVAAQRRQFVVDASGARAFGQMSGKKIDLAARIVF